MEPFRTIHFLGSTRMAQPIRLHDTLSFHFDQFVPNSDPTPTATGFDEQSGRGLGHLDAIGLAGAHHPAGRVDGIAEQLKAGFLSAEDARRHLAGMQVG